MSDELLRYYNSELQYLRRQGDEFAKAHPKVADHLRLGTEGEHDPYVGRLIESIAYLNARIRLKLDDEYPEIASSLIEIMLPHYQRPVPSACIAQLNLDPSQTDLFDGYTVNKHSAVETDTVDGESCQFRSCYPVTCWPFEVADVELRGLPFKAPQFDKKDQASGLLSIELSTFANKNPFSAFNADRIRFFIRLSPPFCFQLYELIFSNVLGVVVAESDQDENPFKLKDAISPVGFGLDEGLVEYPPQSFPGYRLLSEYFAFHNKFLFFDLNLGKSLKNFSSSKIKLFFYLKDRWQDLEPHVDKDTLRLGCTPIVNLFRKRCEPIRLERFDTSYPVIPDIRRPRAHEAYSIEKVTAVSASGKQVEFKPFYSFEHSSGGKQRAFWHATRRSVHSENLLDRGSELEISFVDLDFNPLEPDKLIVDVETLCTNRNLPSRLALPKLQLLAGGAIESVECLERPTEPFHPPMHEELRWRIVSQLTLNHLSLVDARNSASTPNSALAMRELLDLYDFKRDEFTANSAHGLASISSNPILGRIPGDKSGAMCRGLEVFLDFDEEKFTAGNLYLFASVIERFLGLYCNINSFTQAVARSNRRQGELYRWPARAGLQNII